MFEVHEGMIRYSLNFHHYEVHTGNDIASAESTLAESNHTDIEDQTFCESEPNTCGDSSLTQLEHHSNSRDDNLNGRDREKETPRQSTENLELSVAHSVIDSQDETKLANTTFQNSQTSTCKAEPPIEPDTTGQQA